jgi:hypothetical protein
MSYTSKDLSPLVRGDDWTLKLVIQSSGSVLDITGYTYYWTLKADADAADPGDLQNSIVASGADATNGIVYIPQLKAATAGLAAQTYHYDVQQITGTGTVQTLLIGRVKVVKDITLATS